MISTNTTHTTSQTTTTNENTNVNINSTSTILPSVTTGCSRGVRCNNGIVNHSNFFLCLILSTISMILFI